MGQLEILIQAHVCHEFGELSSPKVDSTALKQSLKEIHSFAPSFNPRHVGGPYFVAKYEPVSRFLIDPISITCWINIRARKFTKFIAKYEPVSKFLIDPIVLTCCSQLWC